MLSAHVNGHATRTDDNARVRVEAWFTPASFATFARTHSNLVVSVEGYDGIPLYAKRVWDSRDPDAIEALASISKEDDALCTAYGQCIDMSYAIDNLHEFIDNARDALLWQGESYTDYGEHVIEEGSLGDIPEQALPFIDVYSVGKRFADERLSVRIGIDLFIFQG